MITNPDVRRRLLVWLTTASSAYVLRRMSFRKPKVWCLTGLYELEQVQAFNFSACEPSVTIGIDPQTIAALTGVPIGASIDLGHGVSATQAFNMQVPNVWAAQWQRVDVDYIKLRKDEAPVLPIQLELLPDFSNPIGGVLSGEEETQSNGISAVQIELQPRGQDDGEISDEEEAYRKVFDRAEERIQRSIEF